MQYLDVKNTIHDDDRFKAVSARLTDYLYHPKHAGQRSELSFFKFPKINDPSKSLNTPAKGLWLRSRVSLDLKVIIVLFILSFLPGMIFVPLFGWWAVPSVAVLLFSVVLHVANVALLREC